MAVISLTWFVMALIIARFAIKGDPRNFFVCSRTLPWWVVSCALLCQVSGAAVGLRAVAGRARFSAKATRASQTASSHEQGTISRRALTLMLRLEMF